MRFLATAFNLHGVTHCAAQLWRSVRLMTMRGVVTRFRPSRHRDAQASPQLLMNLSGNLRTIISQRLIPAADGAGRKGAIEILINTPTIADRICESQSIVTAAASRAWEAPVCWPRLRNQRPPTTRRWSKPLRSRRWAKPLRRPRP
jgi:hypothetical protein